MRVSRLVQALTFTTTALVLTACGSDNDSNIVIRDVTPPLLTTNSSFDNAMTAVAAHFISGQIQDSGGIRSLTYQVNALPPQPITLDSAGAFEDRILLAAGINKITLTATDMADNSTELTKNIYLGDYTAAGGAHTGVLKDGQLYGFGRNNFGQTGLGKTSKLKENEGAIITVHPNTPTLMDNAPSDLVSIAFNQNHSLAIDKEGQVYSWGEDKYGQLGRGELGRDNCSRTQDCRLDISAIAAIDNAVMIAPGYRHNLVLTQDGTVWAMGANGQGQLGNGDINNTADNSTPIKVDFSAATDVGRIIQVVASSDSSYALDDKGQVWGWGSDDYANLGRGQQCNAANSCINITPTPTLIKVITTDDIGVTQATEPAITEKVTQLAAGRDHVLALTNTNSVYGWGLNASSQVGYNGDQYGETANAWDGVVTTPTKLPWSIDKDVKRVYANGNESYVITTDGKVYPWGMFGETNSAGRTVYKNLDEPTDKLPMLTNIENLAMGPMHIIAYERADTPNKIGDIFTWGWSFEGSLGNKNAAHIWMYNVPFSLSLPTQSTSNERTIN